MDSVISDKNYDELIIEYDIFEKCGKRHPVLSDTNKILDYIFIGDKVRKDEEQEFDMSNI